jgi:hypothetical protein
MKKTAFLPWVILFDWKGCRLVTTEEALSKTAAVDKFRRNMPGAKVIQCW